MAARVVGKVGPSSRREGPGVGTLGPSTATPSRRKKVPVTKEYVGIDLHRRRSVIVHKNADGELVSKTPDRQQPVGVGRSGRRGRPGAGGGDRGHVRLVLGGRRPDRDGR